MASTSEVGHPKNVANIATLITCCTSYGTNYNPSNNAIKLTALNTLETSAQSQLINVINYSVASTNAINARLAAFQNIKKLASRMLSALTASGATKQQIANAKTINRKIQGNKAKITPPPAPVTTTPSSSTEKTSAPPSGTIVTPPKTISTSQRSYDNLIQHMATFIALLQSITTYNPNETDLKITSLNTYLNTLTSTNNAAVSAHVDANNARIARNKILYAPITGLCDIGEEAKEYVKSVFGSTSPEYKQVRAIKFKKQKI